MKEEVAIKFPPNFHQILLECIDPSQSTDYFTNADSTIFPIQVLPISTERLIINLLKREEDQELALIKAAGELVYFYYPQFTRDWAFRNMSIANAYNFYKLHVEKQEYNDLLIGVIEQIESRIDWIPMDEDDKKANEKYKDTVVFNNAFNYVNFASENFLVQDLVRKQTRGLAELIHLNNRIMSDRFKVKTNNSSSSESNPMTGVETLEDYMAGIQSQGVNLSDLF